MTVDRRSDDALAQGADAVALSLGYSQAAARRQLLLCGLGGLLMAAGGLAIGLLLGPSAWGLACLPMAWPLPAAWTAWRRLHAPEPVLLLDAQGLRDLRLGPPCLRWRDMKAVYLDRWDGDTRLLLAFHSGATVDRLLGPQARRAVDRLPLSSRALAPGANCAVDLTPLDGQGEAVLAVARRLHAQAMRPQPGASLRPT